MLFRSIPVCSEIRHFYQEKFYFVPGDTGFQVFDTAYGKIGVGICWDHNRQFLCQCRKMFYRIIFIHFFCKFIVFISAFLTKILSFKKLRQKDDLCSFFCRFPDKCICLCDIFFHMCASFHLNCGYCDVTFSAHNMLSPAS